MRKVVATTLLLASFFFAFQRFGPLYSRPAGMLKLLGVLAWAAILAFLVMRPTHRKTGT